MRKDKFNGKTKRNLPQFKEINWFLDVKDSKNFYKKYQKKKLRRELKNEEFNIYSLNYFKRITKEGFKWKHMRNIESCKQWIETYCKGGN